MIIYANPVEMEEMTDAAMKRWLLRLGKQLKKLRRDGILLRRRRPRRKKRRKG